MKTKISFALALVTLLRADAQWRHDGPFPSGASFAGGAGVNALAVDPSGRVWIAIQGKVDSILVPGLGRRGVCVIRVYNPDGSSAAFSPIKHITAGGVTDTLWSPATALAVDHRGNIIVGTSNRLYRVDSHTGAGMLRYDDGQTTAGRALAASATGFVFWSPSAAPVRILDSAFTFVGTISPASFGRSLAVSSDAKDVYIAGTTTHCIAKYRSNTGPGGTYTIERLVMLGFECESMTFHPTTGRLWGSAGSVSDRPNRYPGVVTHYEVNTWYAYNLATDSTGEYIKWTFTANDSVNERPRAIAFAPGGDTAYAGVMGSGDVFAVRRYVRSTTDVGERSSDQIPVSPSLGQNYPNPFNPSTSIKYQIPSTNSPLEFGNSRLGFVSLKVYDLLGREVATLVKEVKGSGEYQVQFDASRLSSGVYLYRLESGSMRIAKRLVLMR